MKIVPVNSYCRSNATERAIPFGALYIFLSTESLFKTDGGIHELYIF